MNKIGRWMSSAAPVALSMALLVALPSQALYKVVGPDGKVTYTDTPPPPSSGSKVSQLGANSGGIVEAALPLELRQAVQRYPVTLYAMKVCEPCDSARTLLRQRGVPFNEKLILSNEDTDALQRLSGGRDAPTLTIGGQVLRGLTPDQWNTYLDSAGYPRESRLPATYQYPSATPLTEPPAPTVARQPAPAQQPPADSQIPASSTGIRF